MLRGKTETTDPRATTRGMQAIPQVAALCFLAMTVITAGRYGFYSDELYYIACSKHLDWGYVDHPPMVALLTRLSTWIFGESIFALRFMSGLVGAFIVLLSAWVARLLGGGSFARSLAALLICFASAFPALCSFFSMNPIDVLLCTLFLAVLLRTLEESTAHRWIALGVISGAGLLNKYTFLVLGLSLLIALIAERRWSVLKSPWLYASGAVAALIFLPHWIWQIRYGWPTLDFIRDAMEHKNLALSPLALLGQLTIALNPITLPIWLSGLAWLLASRHEKERRVLGWTAVIFVVIYVALNSKFYYLLPVLPLALSAGAVVLERLLDNSRRRWPRWAILSALALSSAALMPLAVPILPVEQFVKYSQALGLGRAMSTEKGSRGNPMLHFADRLGWEELVREIGIVYGALPKEDRDRCAILASGYGLAGAIDHFGPQHGLPNAISGDKTYWIWGLRHYTGDVVLAVGYGTSLLRELFGKVELVARVEHPYGIHAAVFLCTKPKATLQQLWPRLRT